MICFCRRLFIPGFPLGQFAAFILGGYLCQVDWDGGWPLVFYVYGKRTHDVIIASLLRQNDAILM